MTDRSADATSRVTRAWLGPQQIFSQTRVPQFAMSLLQ